MDDQTPNAVALVTGGTAGIGLACAKTLPRSGRRRIVIAGRTETHGLQSREMLSKQAPDADAVALCGVQTIADIDSRVLAPMTNDSTVRMQA